MFGFCTNDFRFCIEIVGYAGLYTTGLRRGKPRNLHGVWNALSQIYMREGVAGLWRGVLANIARSTLLVCGQLTGYDESKYLLLKFQVMADGPLLHLVAGVVSALASSTLSAPAEVVRSRSMTQGQTFSECTAEIWRVEGASGFFKGVVLKVMNI